MALVLKSFQGDFRLLKAQIAAQYNGVELRVEAVPLGEGGAEPAVSPSPTGKLPVLDTPHGTLFESNAIARFIAGMRRDTELSGRSYFESAQVESWIDFASHDVELPAIMLVYPLLGWKTYNEKVHETASANIHKALSVLEAHLLSRTYLVGEAVTLADIVVVAALFYPFKLMFGADVRDTYPSVTRWFYTCVGKPEFAAVLHFVPVCDEGVSVGAGAGAGAAPAATGAGGKAAGGAGASAGEKKPKEKKPKEEKPKEEKPKEKAKPKKAEAVDDGDDEDLAVKEAPKADPFAHLPKATMVMDEWKRTYSNAKVDGVADYKTAMPWFWEHLDRAGYSLWLQSYKYNEENKKDFMTSNLVGGFVQRTDELRRHAFGVMHVLNSAAPYEVVGAWLLRGQDIKPMLDSNPDAEYYTWVKLDADNAEHRKVVEDYWCSTTKLGEKEIYDSKTFK